MKFNNLFIALWWKTQKNYQIRCDVFSGLQSFLFVNSHHSWSAFNAIANDPLTIKGEQQVQINSPANEEKSRKKLQLHVKSFEIYTGYYFLISSMSYTVTFSFAFWINTEHKKIMLMTIYLCHLLCICETESPSRLK